MNTNLIFDIGMHTAQDTDYYLSCGYRVVAVDAAADLIAQAHEKFADAIADGRLQLVHAAVTNHAGSVTFYQSTKSVWNSMYATISERETEHLQAYTVPATTVAQLMETYGVPYYCKIDIEGADLEAIAALESTSLRPKYLSVESECVGSEAQPDRATILATLHQLAALGYNRFCLVDQYKLRPLSANHRPYRHPSLWTRLLHHLRIRRIRWIPRDTGHKGFTFDEGSSGKFAEQLGGPWLTLPEAEKLILMQRADFFGNHRKARKSWEFWCDWHATRVD